MDTHANPPRAWKAFAAAWLLVIVTALAGAAAAQQALDPGALVGVWRGYERTGDMNIATELIVYDNGAYQKSAMLGNLMSFNSGNWTVQANWLHFQPTDYEPKVYLGIRQSPPPSETWVVDYFDGRNLHAMVGITEVSYQRVQ